MHGPDEEVADEEGADDEEGLRRGGTSEEGFGEARRAGPDEEETRRGGKPDEESNRRGGTLQGREVVWFVSFEEVFTLFLSRSVNIL